MSIFLEFWEREKKVEKRKKNTCEKALISKYVLEMS